MRQPCVLVHMQMPATQLRGTIDSVFGHGHQCERVVHPIIRAQVLTWSWALQRYAVARDPPKCGAGSQQGRQRL